MKYSHLPDETTIAYAHLQVQNIQRALEFYQDRLGFQMVERYNGTAALSATGRPPHTLLLSENRNATPKPARTTGLYHVAIRLPDRPGLAHTLKRLLDFGWRFIGAADHGVSEALYTTDPDGNGLELYVDRPRSRWNWRGGQVKMVSDPLDISDLLGDSKNGHHSLPATTDVGHIHLQVADLQRSAVFYHDLLGLEITQSDYPGALFLAAGNYHHHIGLNVWAGHDAPPPPGDAVGLKSFGLLIPDMRAWEGLLARLQAAGVPMEEKRQVGRYSSVAVHDPDGNRVELLI